MAYASGGTIAATDFNGLAQTNAANVAFVWGLGAAQYGYGQSTTALATLTTGTTVTAAQWSAFLTVLNNANQHQGGAALNYAYTAGQTIAYLANVATAVTTINTNAATAAAVGTVVNGTTFTTNPTAAVNTNYGESAIATRIATFASDQAARYFFNAGGRLYFSITAISNNDASARSTALVTLAGTANTFTFDLRNTTGDGVTGNGTNALGYRSLTTSFVGVKTLTATGTYSGDFFKLYAKTNSINGSGTGDYGSIISFQLNLYSAGHGSWDTSLNVTVSHQLRYYPASTTYLSTAYNPTIT